MASILDTPTSVASATHTFSVSAGTNRCLIVGVTQEGTTLGAPTVTYGGQSMVNVIDVEINPGTTSQRVTLFFLNDAGIQAASGTTITVSNGTATISTHAASYEDCVQTTPTNTDSDSSTAATPNPLADCDIVTGSANSIVVALSGMGNDGTAAWGGTLTERTEQSMATTATGSLADDEVPTATTIACECTWTTQNRAAIVALELAHLSAEGITSIDPDEFDMDNGDIDVNSTPGSFDVSGNDVYLSPNDLLSEAGEVDISAAINTESATVINLDLTQLSGATLALLHTMGPGARYVIVDCAGGEYFIAVTLHRPEAFVMSLGAGTPGATTARLTAPATKTTGDFDAGRFEEAANPATAVNITIDNYTEMVFSIEAQALARDVQYDFRITKSGVVVDTYSVTPQLTITSGEERAVAGILGAAGVVSRVVTFGRSQAGGVDGAGSVARVATLGRAQVGNLTGSGTVTRGQTLSRAIAGAQSFAGAVDWVWGLVTRAIAGAFGATGTVTRVITRVRKITGQL